MLAFWCALSIFKNLDNSLTVLTNKGVMIQKVGAGIIVPPESVLDTHEGTVLQVPTDKEKPGLIWSLTRFPVWIRHTWVTFRKESKKKLNVSSKHEIYESISRFCHLFNKLYLIPISNEIPYSNPSLQSKIRLPLTFVSGESSLPGCILAWREF